MDGNVMLSTELDTRPVTQSLSNLKRKIVEVFKGADVKTLSSSLKAVNAEIKATEAQARKAQAALDALMRGDKDPQVIKVINSELKSAQGELSKVQTKLNDLLNGRTEPKATKAWLAELKTIENEYAQLEKKANVAGAALAKDLQPEHPRGYTPLTDKQRDDLRAEMADYDTRMSALQNRANELRQAIGAVRMHPELTNEAKRYQQQIDELQKKIQALQLAEQDVRQNPALTVEAQQYQQQIDNAKAKLDELRAKQDELGASAQRVGVMTRLQQSSVVSGFQHIERRIVGLIKRIFFFTLITKALRSIRSEISALIASDSQLSASLAQVRGNLATAFGMIWQAVLPAIRAMINWLAKATAYIAAFISWLTGKSFKAGRTAFESANKASAGVAKNTGKIGKAAKKAAKEAQKMLLPFDQMNVLSKDNAGGGAGGGGAGGGGGGGIGGLGMTWPKEMDIAMNKFEMFKDLILLIGAAFAAWKLAPIASALLGISKITAFAGLTSLIFGIFELIAGIKDLIKNGPNVNNVCQIMAGALLIVGGACTLLLGPWGLIISAIGLLVLGFRHLYNSNKNFKKWIDTIIKLFKEKKFVEAGKMIITGIFNGIKKAIKKAGQWIVKHVFKPIKKAIKKAFGISSPAKKMLSLGEDIALGILKGIMNHFLKVGAWVYEHIFTPIKEALLGGADDEGLFVSIGAKFADTKETLSAKWDELTSSIAEKIVTLWSEVKEKVKGAIEALKEKWDALKDKTATLLSEAKEKVAGAIESLKDKWEAIKDRTATLTASAKEAVGGVLNGIKDKWNAIGNKTATLTAQLADHVNNSVLNKLKGAWSAIHNKTATLKVNLQAAVAKGWNSLAKKFNSLKSKSKIFKSLPTLPYLAQGAVIPANSEFLAVLGDQKRGVNIETPLQTMVDAFNTALKANGISGTQSVNVYLQGDAKQLFRVVRVEANNYTQSTGKAAFNL